MGSLVNSLRRLVTYLKYGGTRALRPYEQRCLERLRVLLSEDGGRILERQLAAIDLVQRYSNDRLVLLHFPEGGTDSVERFPNRSDECRAARMRLRPSHGGALTADVVFHAGRLSSIEFNKTPSDPLEEGSVIGDATLLEDLMVEAPGEVVGPPVLMPGSLLHEISQKVQIENVTGPAPEGAVTRFLSLVGAVPTDYAGLLRETDGFKAGDWRFMGTRARRVTLPSKTLWLAAETGQVAVCLEEGGAEASVLLYDQIDDESREIGEAFVPALLQAVLGLAPEDPG
jgi:hypothetical protein